MPVANKGGYIWDGTQQCHDNGRVLVESGARGVTSPLRASARSHAGE